MFKNKVKLSKIQVIVLIVLAVIILGTITNGTYAWLTDKTSILNSNFTYGNIKININETEQPEDGYMMLPGKEIKKDPVVTVDKDSENCWLYIEIIKSNNFDEFMTYELADGWTMLDENKGIYYRTVSKSSKEQKFMIIKDNIIKAKSDLTKEKLNSLKENKNYPTLSVSAYAIQRDEKIDELKTAEKAWLLTSDQE